MAEVRPEQNEVGTGQPLGRGRAATGVAGAIGEVTFDCPGPSRLRRYQDAC
jgi:hypothetical protein